MKPEALIVYTTVADESTADRLGERLVDARLAACVQIVPGVRSVYRWDGVVRHDREVQLLVKTTADRFDALEAVLHEHHRYDLPEIVAVPIVRGSQAYLDWIARDASADADPSAAEAERLDRT
jgi:periplasmic divalent cation tolerance protein